MSKPTAAKTLIVVAGPTAVGKTALAIELAKHYQTEIISADSRQFYREMSIGTAKPTKAELAQARHHFIDNLSVTDAYNVADFEKQAMELLDGLFISHDKVIAVGGSGLFIKAICEGFDDIPVADIAIRNHLNQAYAENGIGWLQNQLQTLDPEYYQKVDRQNPQRLIRALEVIESTGKPFSAYHKAEIKTRPFNIIKIGLNLWRPLLYERINQRVDSMMEQGLFDEVKSLTPYRHLNPLITVGYTEIFDYLDGKHNLATAIGLIKQNTRRFAKRQLTWFNQDQSVKWFEPNELHPIVSCIES